LKIIVVTPAGRKAYLELLSSYLLSDDDVFEWHLWDNCRDESDRVYINSLEVAHEKIKVVRVPNVDGTNRSVNKFYKNCNRPDVFYVKIDDDVVYITKGTFTHMRDEAIKNRARYIWWSPMVINNALCSYLIKYKSKKVIINPEITAQAACPTGWGSPHFAIALHDAFLQLVNNDEPIISEDFDVSLSRFSINCIGFFGADVLELGDLFCPPNVDDEEWISGVLPVLTNRMGKILGACTVSHYSFYTQEYILNETDILDRYYALAGFVRRHSLPKTKKPPRQFRRRSYLRRLIEERLVKLGLKNKKRAMVELR
jgi:hypothetical protein